MKPKLVLGFGAFSASTPLYKTLIRKIRKHVAKEPNILPSIYSNNYENTIKGKYLQAIRKNREGSDIFAPGNQTISYYIDWLLEKNCDVCDFSNPHAQFHTEIIEKFANQFKKHFSVKVLMICRDPVRRLYSNLNFIPNSGHSLEKYGQNKRLEVVMDYISEPPEVKFPSQDWDYRKKHYTPFTNGNYQQIYDNWSQFFDTHVIIMEDLWANRENELERLNNFLETNITTLHKNLYYPFQGPNAIFDDGLKDQWRSETEWIKKENLLKAREKMSWAYTIQGRNPWKTDEWLE